MPKSSNVDVNSGIPLHTLCGSHYSDVIMSAMASPITSLTIVYSTVFLGAGQRKHQNSAPLAFVRGIHRWPVNSPHKGPVTRKCFHLMTSSWQSSFSWIQNLAQVPPLPSLYYMQYHYIPFLELFTRFTFCCVLLWFEPGGPFTNIV